MAHYRAYVLNNFGRIVAAMSFDAVDEPHALEIARDRGNGQPVKLICIRREAETATAIAVGGSL